MFRAAALSLLITLTHAATPGINDDAQAIFEFWTSERVASAVPLDLFIESTNTVERLFDTTTSDADWTGGGAVNEAAGRLVFSLGDGLYVCSGTVINDHGTVGRSLVVTAAHCAYDDVADVHATNVLFIPKQDDGGPDGSNLICNDDPYGCWAMTLGLVDSRWRDGDWPYNIAYDYAIYVVPDDGGYFMPGYYNTNPVLDSAVPGLDVDFTNEQGIVVGSWAHLMGYSYDKDPNFRYCFDALISFSFDSENYVWELPGCLTTGGSSGGPGLLNPSGNGKLYSVKSYGYSIGSGGGGPALFNNSFSCIFERAKVANGNEVLTYGGQPCSPPLCTSCDFDDLKVYPDSALDGKVAKGTINGIALLTKCGMTVTPYKTNGSMITVLDSEDPVRNTTNHNYDPDLGSPNIGCGGVGRGVGGRPGRTWQNCAPLGNVLVLQDATFMYPNDNRRGGCMKFTFVKNPVTNLKLGLLDIDSIKPALIKLVDVFGISRSWQSANTGDNGYWTSDSPKNTNTTLSEIFLTRHVTALHVCLPGQGAVTHVNYCNDPYMATHVDN